MRLFTRLLLGAVGILTLSTAVLLYASNHWLRESLNDAFAEELEKQARIVAAALSTRPTDLNMAAHRYGAMLGRRVTFIDPDGTVLGDSDFDNASLALLDNHRSRPELQLALAGRVGVHQRLSASTGRQELKVAVPAWPGAVRISAPLAQLDALQARVARAILLAALAALGFGVMLTALAARAVARPVRRLAEAAQQAATGGIPTYPTSSIPEVTEVVRSVHSMQEQLTARIAELHHERQETVALIDSMEQGVLAASAKGELLLANPSARHLLGFQVDDPMPNLRELFHRLEAREIVERGLAGEIVPGEEVQHDGHSILMTAHPLPGGGAVLGLLDTTDLKRLQVVRRDFVANVSHELKTPLTSIIGYAETLLGEEVTDADRQRFVETIVGNAYRMQRLVDDLLDLARLESGGWVPSYERVDLKTATQNAWGHFEQAAHTRGIAFGIQIAAGVTVDADAQALGQILDNLFDNALRHTPQGGSISVDAVRNDGELELTVSDTGIGIPANHIPRVFERFYRVDPGRSREEGGTGLGLAIVKHLVEAHGGRVALESVVGKGTTVRIHLPTARIPSPT